MKTLLILRHAKSSWKQSGLTDHDRPLNNRGERDAPQMGRFVHRQGLRPDLIVSSTARRARSTAQAVADHSGCDADVQLEPDFYHAGISAIIHVLREVPDDCPRVMIVGHNPIFEEFLARLTGRCAPLPTAALARLTLPIDHWAELGTSTRGDLVGVWRPDKETGEIVPLDE